MSSLRWATFSPFKFWLRKFRPKASEISFFGLFSAIFESWGSPFRIWISLDHLDPPNCPSSSFLWVIQNFLHLTFFNQPPNLGTTFYCTDNHHCDKLISTVCGSLVVITSCTASAVCCMCHHDLCHRCAHPLSMVRVFHPQYWPQYTRAMQFSLVIAIIRSVPLFFFRQRQRHTATESYHAYHKASPIPLYPSY